MSATGPTLLHSVQATRRLDGLAMAPVIRPAIRHNTWTHPTEKAYKETINTCYSPKLTSRGQSMDITEETRNPSGNPAQYMDPSYREGLQKDNRPLSTKTRTQLLD